VAEFNPSTQTNEQQAPSNLGVSRGTGPNQAFEALFSGLGEAISNGVQTADTYVQGKIENDARYGYESINQEMNLDVDTVPSELTQSQEGLQKLAAAHMQGNVTNEYYYQRLASTLKGLRSRYPGYEKQVDSIVQSVTGVNPANAYRNALMQNIENQQQAMASQQGKFDSWAQTKENSEVLGILYPDFYSNPDKYSDQEMRNQVKANVSQYQGRIRLSEDTTKLRSNDKVVAKQQLGQLFGTIGSGYIVGGSEAAGVDSPNVQNLLQTALADGKIVPEEQEQINGFLAQIRVKAEQDMRQRYQTSDWGSNFSSSELNDEVKNGLSQIDSMIELVNSGNINAASQIAARNKAMTDQATADLYKTFPDLRVASAVRNISEAGADKIIDMVIENAGGGMSFINKTLGKDITKSLTSGKTTMNQVTGNVLAAQGKTGKEKEQLLSAVLDGAVGTLTAPEATPDIKANTVQNVYGDNLDATWDVVDDSVGAKGTSQRFRLYNKMFNPKITKEITALNDPKALATYTAAAVDKFQQIPEFRRAAADLTENIDYTKYLRAHYDPQRNRVILEANEEAINNLGFFETGSGVMSGQKFQLQAAIKAKDAFNQGLAVMAPIIEANGADETEGIKTLMQSVAADLQKDPKQGFFGWLNESLDNIIAPDPRKGTGLIAPDSKLGKIAAERGRQMDAAESDTNFKEIGETSNTTPKDERDNNVTFTPINFTAPELEKASASGGQAAILNLLGKTEGTDRGRGYNETLGYGAFTGGDVDITSMSLDDVDALQTDMLAHPNNKWNSSALGRYQIIRTTLRGLKKELGLSGDEIFTPELQDRLAQALLERRGLSRYRAGEISGDQFINNLAKEWASLPTTSGQGAYAGQRRSGTTPSAVLTAFAGE
jgi:muramidase (phage lysozyme)